MNPNGHIKRSPLIDLGLRLGTGGLVVGGLMIVLGVATMFALGDTAGYICEAGFWTTVGSGVVGLCAFAASLTSERRP